MELLRLSQVCPALVWPDLSSLRVILRLALVAAPASVLMVPPFSPSSCLERTALPGKKGAESSPAASPAVFLERVRLPWSDHPEKQVLHFHVQRVGLPVSGNRLCG